MLVAIVILLFCTIAGLRFWLFIIPLFVLLHFISIDKPPKNGESKLRFIDRYKSQANIPVFIIGLAISVVSSLFIPILEAHQLTIVYYLLFGTGLVMVLVSANPKINDESKQEKAAKPRQSAQSDQKQAFGVWRRTDLNKSGQSDRYYRSITQDLPFLSVNVKHESAEIIGTQGTIYFVTLNYCECEDFRHRHLPCKHIYKLARELKYIS